jgi:peptidoglycan endopeptidase LytE
LGAGAIVAGLIGAAGAPAGWWLALTLVLLAVAWVAAYARMHQLAVHREFDFAGAFGRSDGTVFGDLDGLAVLPEPAAPAPPPKPALASGATGWAVTRFVLASLAGWLLSPVIAVVGLALGHTEPGSAARAWLERLESLQERLRDHAVKAVAVSMVATAGVTAAGASGVVGASSAFASPSPAASSSAGASTATGTRYQVQAGDTLWAIAARTGTTVAELASLNHLADPNLILIGQILIIPGAGGTSSAPTAPATTATAPAPPAPDRATVGASGRYLVRPGDTLSAIAARTGTTVAELASLNHLADPNLILIGQILIIRGAGSTTTTPAEPAPTAAAPTPSRAAPAPATPAPAPAAAPAPSKAISGSRYLVRPGDTLSAIAARAGTTVAELAALNHLADPNLIFAGQVLLIPGPGVATAPSAPILASAPRPGPVAPPAPAPAASSRGSLALQAALTRIGSPYQWAGAGPSTFDCSGLVMWAWAQVGVSLPHYSVAQYEDTARISQSQLEPGDLVFYDTGGGAQPGHVAMYDGNGNIVVADNFGTRVRVEPMTWDGTPMGFGRVA